MDTIKDLLGVLGRVDAVIEGADAIKVTMRTRMKDYRSVLQVLQGSAPAVFKHELKRLQDLFTDIVDLHAKHTADPEDGRPAKIAKRVNRGTQHKSIEEALDTIDREVVRQFMAIAAKSSINAEAVKVVLEKLQPPPLPEMAAVPAGTNELPHSYVERAAVRKVADGLTNTDDPRAPYTIVGMGGGGKTILASAVVRSASVREHFRGGIFWVRVGRGAKNSLLPLLQGLAREMGAAPTDSPHGVPHVLDSLEQVTQHLVTVASTGTSPRLVVLDDVWEREVVDAFLPLGLKVMVTTRDESVVGVPTGCLKLGDMTEEEALELLLKTSRTVGQPGEDVRKQMNKVVERCGRLPLLLAIAGSMPVVKGKGLTAGSWGELTTLFENVAKMMRARGEQPSSLNTVLEASFDALSERKQEEVLKTAVLAPGAVAPIEMLLNLWDTKDAEGTREEADGLVSKCLLQDVDGGGYRAHDLVLDFMKIKIKADAEMAEGASALQAQYLARLDVVESYSNPVHGAGNQGFFVLGALWRSVEKLSGDPRLEVASYRASLGKLESREPTTKVAEFYLFVGFLFDIQGKYNEADPLSLRAVEIGEKTLGSDHPDLATLFNHRVQLLSAQGKYAEADPLCLRAIAIGEKVLGPEHPRLAAWLHNRAKVLKNQGKYAEADPLYLRSIEISEKALGPDHPDVGKMLNNRAGLLASQGKYAEADPLYLRAIEIQEKTLGPDHPGLAKTLINRAGLLENQGKYAEADPLYLRAIEIAEKTLGPDHPDVAVMLDNRAGLLARQGKFDEADPLFRRAIDIGEKTLGPDHLDIATHLTNRAQLLRMQGKYSEAEPLQLRAMAIEEKYLGPDHPDFATSLLHQADSLMAQDKYDEAEPLYARATAVLEKALGPEHPTVATALNDRAGLLTKQGNYADAESLFARATAIWEKALGPEHPSVATALNNRAFLCRSQGKYAEAEPLYQRSQAIREKILGPEHPDVAQSLLARAGLSQDQENYAAAIPLLERALSIRTKKLGGSHPDTVSTQNRLEIVQRKA